MLKIFETMGPPSEDDLNFDVHEEAYGWIKSQKVKAAVGLRGTIPRSPLIASFHSDLIDLLQGLLAFNPRRRLSCTAAKSHALFEDVWEAIDDEDEYNTPEAVEACANFRMEEIEECPHNRSEIKKVFTAEIQRVEAKMHARRRLPSHGLLSMVEREVHVPSASSSEAEVASRPFTAKLSRADLSLLACDRHGDTNMIPSTTKRSNSCNFDLNFNMKMSSQSSSLSTTGASNVTSAGAPAGTTAGVPAVRTTASSAPLVRSGRNVVNSISVEADLCNTKATQVHTESQGILARVTGLIRSLTSGSLDSTTTSCSTTSSIATTKSSFSSSSTHRVFCEGVLTTTPENCTTTRTRYDYSSRSVSPEEYVETVSRVNSTTSMTMLSGEFL